MRIPTQIHFHGMQASPTLREDIKQHTEKLSRFAPNIQSCRVVVERATKRHHRGNLYQVKLHLNLPGCVIAAGETHLTDRTHEDAHVAVRDTFDAARRQLGEFEQVRRGEVKHHSPPADIGQIIAIDRAQGIGAVVTSDGSELLFYRYDVVGTDFNHLMEGQVVRFVAVNDEHGVTAGNIQIPVSRTVRHQASVRI